jgi:hypothetical protein
MDVLNRILDHRHFNAKNGEGERNRLASYLTGEANWSNIANRYMLKKFMSSLPTVDFRCRLPESKARTDLQELQRSFLKNVSKLVDFKAADAASLATEFENRYGLAQKLSRQDLSGAIELDEYLNCRSQLEYVMKLRSALQNKATT